MLAFRNAMICISAIALLPMAFRASIGAGSDESRATSHADSVDAGGDETAASGRDGPQPAEQSSGAQLLAAVKRGDVAKVLKLVELGAYVPGSLNGLRALKTAKDRGYAEIVALLQPAFDKYWEDGVAYDNMITPVVNRYRQDALETPDNSSVYRAFSERLAYTTMSAFFQSMSKRDSTGLWAPMTERFDENELRRRVTEAFDAVDEELQARPEAAARDTILFMMRFAPEIHQAAARGDVEQLTDLLQDGANPNVQADTPLAPMPQSSPLHYAASTGQVPAIDVLVNAGADVNAQDRDKKTPLHAASGEGHIAAISALFEAGADPNGIPGQVTPLHSAARKGHVAAIRVLVEAGADVNIPDGGQRPLHAASVKGHMEAISALIEAGADPNALARMGVTPLHAAAGSGHVDAVAALLEAGANPNAPTSEGTTPLHEAALSGNVDVVAALLEAGANTRARDKLGRTAEIMANIRGHAETKKLLQDIDPGAPRTGALHSAAFGGDLKEVASLLEAGADPNARDEHQRTPLHKAMLLVRLGIGHDEVVVSLLAAGADPNAQDENQITPLHMAVMLGTVETINALIAAGADTNLRTAANETPLQLAERLGRSDLADALR